ncbi:MAG: TorF family putative porin [Gammaproteobacteria bacterium]|nr:TorF family putative porin [Gammaproteobacteria bacterium]
MNIFNRIILTNVLIITSVTSLAAEHPHPLPHTKLIITPAPAKITASPVTGNFAITSNYIFRGISQSNNLPAFQGGLTYTFATTGIYLNIWGSNVNQTANNGAVATLEVDQVAGITNKIKDFSYDAHFVHYAYPKAGRLNYNELIGSVSYLFLTGLVGLSNNVFNTHTTGVYYNLNANFDLPQKFTHFKDVSAGGCIGYYSLTSAAGKSYNDYMLYVNKIIHNYVLTLKWTNTNHRLLNNSLDGSHFIAAVAVNF